MGKIMLNFSVARWERGLQGFDDDPDWWLHPLLPYAHRSQCGQVHHCQHRQHHHLPQIDDTSPHKNIIINRNDHCLVILLQIHQHQQSSFFIEQCSSASPGKVFHLFIFYLFIVAGQSDNLQYFYELELD